MAPKFDWQKQKYYVCFKNREARQHICGQGSNKWPYNVYSGVLLTDVHTSRLQGDEEKTKGLTPMPMMDREKKHELPQLEVSG